MGMRQDREIDMDVQYFEGDFPRNVDIEEMYFSMNGYKLS